jgi:hypothetical protein
MHKWTVTPSQTSRGTCEWIDRHNKRVDEVFLHFQLEMKTLGVLSAPAANILRAEVNTLWFLQLKINICGHVNWCE